MNVFSKPNQHQHITLPKHTQFTDVFGSGNPEECSKDTRTGTNRFAPTARDACVSHCLFHDISSESSGGAVGCSGSSDSGVQRIYIEETTFTTCKTTNQYGGGSTQSSSGQYASIETNSNDTIISPRNHRNECKNLINESNK